MIQTRKEKPTEPSSWRRIRPGVRKTPEPMTEPMKRRKRSRSRRVRGREARVSVEGASVLVGRVAAILAGQEGLWEGGRGMRKKKPNARGAGHFCGPPHIMEER